MAAVHDGVYYYVAYVVMCILAWFWAVLQGLLLTLYDTVSYKCDSVSYLSRSGAP